MARLGANTRAHGCDDWRQWPSATPTPAPPPTSACARRRPQPTCRHVRPPASRPPGSDLRAQHFKHAGGPASTRHDRLCPMLPPIRPPRQLLGVRAGPIAASQGRPFASLALRRGALHRALDHELVLRHLGEGQRRLLHDGVLRSTGASRHFHFLCHFRTLGLWLEWAGLRCTSLGCVALAVRRRCPSCRKAQSRGRCTVEAGWRARFLDHSSSSKRRKSVLLSAPFGEISPTRCPLGAIQGTFVGCVAGRPLSLGEPKSCGGAGRPKHDRRRGKRILRTPVSKGKATAVFLFFGSGRLRTHNGLNPQFATPHMMPANMSPPCANCPWAEQTRPMGVAAVPTATDGLLATGISPTQGHACRPRSVTRFPAALAAPSKGLMVFHPSGGRRSNTCQAVQSRRCQQSTQPKSATAAPASQGVPETVEALRSHATCALGHVESAAMRPDANIRDGLARVR